MLRRSIAGALVLGSALAAAAPAQAINCEQARKYAGTGRTAEEIADTMVADLDEVKKCLAQGGASEKGGEKKPAQGQGAAAPAAGQGQGTGGH